MSYTELFKLKDILISNKKNIIFENKIRKRKLTLEDIISYRFYYSEYNKTKQSIISSLNYDNNKMIHMSSYIKKENKIPLTFYQNTFNEIKNELSDIIDKKSLNIFAIDGTYSNTNINRQKGKIQTSLNMGYFDIINKVPVDITFNGAGSKNNEVNRANEWIKNNNIQNTIFVCDRAYFKYDFFKYLIDNKLNFIIRIKENSDLKNTIKETNIKKDTVNYVKNNSRLIEYKVTHIKHIINKNKEKINLECTNNYTLITNIPESNKLFTDEYIKDIYKNRWLIEVFFKHLKTNFNFEHLKEKQDIKYKKNIYCGLIVIYIAKLIKKYSLENNKFKNKSINESNLVKGIYMKLLKHIINDTLTEIIITNFINSYIVPIINKKNRSFNRISITPFTKWYVKGYTDKYKYNKMLNTIENNTHDSLHPNLKTKIKNKKCV
jgi:hypothetical protein